MAFGLPARQLPGMLARRQPRVSSACRRLQSTSATQSQNPAYPLYPSVTQLLHEKGIPATEIPKIPASGPKGRLLKGDVLAYIGSIASDYPSAQAAQLAKLSHLDLSNVKVAPAAKPAEKEQKAPEAVAAAPPATASVAISISLAAVLSVQRKMQKKLGTRIPVSEFLARASELANEELPRARTEKRSADELFDELLGEPAIMTSRGDYIPELNVVEVSQGGSRRGGVKEDLIDFLAGKKEQKTTVAETPLVEEQNVMAADNVFSLTVPVGDEFRARTFLERVQALLQTKPGRLVL